MGEVIVVLRPCVAAILLGTGLLVAAPGASADEPPGWDWPPNATNLADGETCLASLTAMGVAWKHGEAADRITTPIEITDLDLNGLKLVPTFREPPFLMDCHLALALATHAPELRAAGIAELHFTSIHSFRKVAGTNRLSRHAYGLAIDVFAVRTVQGRVFEVEKQYRHRDLRLFRQLLSTKIPSFRSIFTPINDPRGHHDHVHFEAHRGALTLAIATQQRQARREAKRQARKKRAQRRARARKTKAKRAKARRAKAREARARRAQARRARARKQRERKAKARKAKARRDKARRDKARKAKARRDKARTQASG